MRNKYVMLPLMIMLNLCGLFFSSTTKQEELIKGPYKVEFRNDFNGDGIADVILISWNIVKDYERYMFEILSDEKYVWYQADLRISSPTGKVYHEDNFSIKEGDFLNMVSIIGKENMTPQFYFENFFSIPSSGSTLNNIVSRPISIEELDMAYIGKLIKSKNVEATPEAVAAELTTNDHIVILYIRDWLEDWGIIAYSRLLDQSVFLISPFDR